MLSEIQKTEQKMREKIEAAKVEAAATIHKARTDIADSRKALEETLRTTEAAAIAKAETEAEKKAAELVAKAESEVSSEVSDISTKVAKEVLASYLK